MTNFDNVRRKIKKLAREVELEHGDHLIMKIPNGYKVLTKFNLVLNEDDTWTVTQHQTLDSFTFNSVKNAMLWCMAINGGNKIVAKSLYKLDQKLFSKQFDIQNKLRLLHNPNIDYKVQAVLQIKLDEDIRISHQIKEDLRKQVNHAKYIKTKGSPYEFTGLERAGH